MAGTFPQVTTLSGNTSLNASHRNRVVLVNATATLTLEDATTFGDNLYFLKNVSAAGVVTISPVSAQTIDGASSYSLFNQYQYVWIISDGSNWQIIGAN